MGARHFLVISLMDLSQTPMADYPHTAQSILLATAENTDRDPTHCMFYNFIHPTPSVYNIMEQDMMNNAEELQS